MTKRAEYNWQGSCTKELKNLNEERKGSKLKNLNERTGMSSRPKRSVDKSMGEKVAGRQRCSCVRGRTSN